MVAKSTLPRTLRSSRHHPVENGDDNVGEYTSSKYTQADAARIFGVPINKVTCKGGRIGGGFGGKETRWRVITSVGSLQHTIVAL